LETTLSRRIAFPIRCDIIIIIYRIVSRALALFYFYLPPRLSFSLLLKRTTNTLSSFRGGKISEEKEEIRENRPENEATFFRKILIKEFHLRNRKKLSLVVDDWYAHTQTHTLSLSLSLSLIFSLCFVTFANRRGFWRCLFSSPK
jgi:hypothetical protein